MRGRGLWVYGSTLPGIEVEGEGEVPVILP